MAGLHVSQGHRFPPQHRRQHHHIVIAGRMGIKAQTNTHRLVLVQITQQTAYERRTLKCWNVESFSLTANAYNNMHA